MQVYSNLSGSGNYVQSTYTGLFGRAAGEQYHFIGELQMISYTFEHANSSNLDRAGSFLADGYNNYIDPAFVWINKNINPLTPFVELVTGKEYSGQGFINNKQRLQSASQVVIAIMPFGKIAGIGERMLANSAAMNADQIALKSLVDEATLGGRQALSQSEAEAAMQMANDINYPGFRVSPADLDPFNNHWIGGPHFHFPGLPKGGGHISIFNP